MTTLHHSSLTTTCIVIAALLCLLLLLPASSFHQQLARGILFEDKTRLGSRPPSCHNKCNGCHPCMAVQVPTVPSHSRVQPGLGKGVKFLHSYPSPSGYNRYSNYKPLGWRCRYGGRFYNP